MMNDKNLYLKGNQTKGMMVSEKIVEDLQKKRYELIERRTNTKNMSVQKRVMKDVVDCENTILAVCEGRFPK
jgi:ribose 5-phosphate isomerase RpiB